MRLPDACESCTRAHMRIVALFSTPKSSSPVFERSALGSFARSRNTNVSSPSASFCLLAKCELAFSFVGVSAFAKFVLMPVEFALKKS